MFIRKIYVGIILWISLVELILISLMAILIKTSMESPDIRTITVNSEPIIIIEDSEDSEELEIPVYTEDIPEEEDLKSDERIIAEVVMAEAGNQEMIGKVAVAITLLNRRDSTGKDLETIALDAYAYPYTGIITSDCYRAVEIAMNNRDLFPEDMFYFRTSYYHDFGEPYMKIQDHYFSTEE